MGRAQPFVKILARGSNKKNSLHIGEKSFKDLGGEDSLPLVSGSMPKKGISHDHTLLSNPFSSEFRNRETSQWRKIDSEGVPRY